MCMMLEVGLRAVTFMKQLLCMSLISYLLQLVKGTRHVYVRAARAHSTMRL